MVQKLKHKRGDTYNGLQLIFEYEQVDGVVQDPPVPIDLTDCTIKSKFRYGSSCGGTFKEFTNGSGIEITDAVNGIVTILENTVINWNTGEWHFDVEITFPTGVVKTYLTGVLEICNDITH